MYAMHKPIVPIFVILGVFLVLTFPLPAVENSVEANHRAMWQRSEAAYREGKLYESIKYAIESIILNPRHIRAQIFVRENFDFYLSQSETRMQRLQKHASADQSLAYFLLLDSVYKITATLRKTSLPYTQPRHLPPWEPAVNDVASLRKAARERAFNLNLIEVQRLVSLQQTQEVKPLLRSLVTQLTNDDNHRLQVMQQLVDDICFQASRSLNTTDIEKAITAHQLFLLAATLLPKDTEVQAGIVNSALYVAHLHVEMAQQAETTSEIAGWKTALKHYQSALRLDSTNTLAVQNEQRVRITLAEQYYQLAQSNVKRHNFKEALEQFTLVQSFVHHFKDTNAHINKIKIKLFSDNYIAFLHTQKVEMDILHRQILVATQRMNENLTIMNGLAQFSLLSIETEKSIRRDASKLNTFSEFRIVRELTSELRANLELARMPIDSLAFTFTKINAPYLLPTFETVKAGVTRLASLNEDLMELKTLSSQIESYVSNLPSCEMSPGDSAQITALGVLVDSLHQQMQRVTSSRHVINTQFILLDNTTEQIRAFHAFLLPVLEQTQAFNRWTNLLTLSVGGMEKVLNRRWSLAGYRMTARSYLTRPPLPIRIVREEWDALIHRNLQRELMPLSAPIPPLIGVNEVIKRLSQLPDWEKALRSQMLTIRIQNEKLQTLNKTMHQTFISLKNTGNCP